MSVRQVYNFDWLVAELTAIVSRAEPGDIVVVAPEFWTLLKRNMAARCTGDLVQLARANSVELLIGDSAS